MYHSKETFRYNDYNVGQTHPINSRDQTYFLERKVLSIHSEDRDVNKWKYSNEFELQLPQDYKNIYSMRLLNIELPSVFYNITYSYQNSKIAFRIQPDISGNSGAEYNALNTKFNLPGDNNLYTIQLDDGYYQPDELALTIQNKMNETITRTMIDLYGLSSSYVYSYCIVKYNKVKHSFVFLNTRDNFELAFDVDISYPNIPNNQKCMWNENKFWGLPYDMGFEKLNYLSSITPTYKVYYDETEIYPNTTAFNIGVKYVEAPDMLQLFAPSVLYMELDRYNTIDEIMPYSVNTTNTFNNDYHARNNGAFARIPLYVGSKGDIPYSVEVENKNTNIHNIVIFQNPLPKLTKMRFRFRFHDGRIVDFHNKELSFCIEINQLIDEQHRKFIVHVPPMYS